MMNKAIVLCTALFGTFFCQIALADGNNPLRDAGFELQQPPEQGGWILFGKGWFSEDESRTGDQSMFNWGFSRTVPFPASLIGTVSGSYQEFAASPGSRWRLTGFGAAPTPLKGDTAFGILQVSFFDARGNDLGTVETAGNTTTRAKISNEVNSRSPKGEWIFLDTGIATAPDGTASVQAFTLFVDYSGADISQGVYFDDLSLCALEDGDDAAACKEFADDMTQDDD